jgi:hypothetical protein
MNKLHWMRWAMAVLPVLLAARLPAQLRAGDWLADAVGYYRYSAIEEPAQRLHEYEFTADFHFFPLERLAVGGRLSNQYLAFNDDFFQASDLAFTIEPKVRYYLLTAPIPFFVEASGYWRRTELSQFGISGQRAEGLGFSLGVGANLLFAERGCVEGLVEYRYRESLDQAGQQDVPALSSLMVGARLRAYLGVDSEAAGMKGPGLGAVRSGNWMAGGRIGGALSFGSPDFWDINALGSIFLSSRLALGLGVEFQGFPSANRLEEGYFTRSLEPFLRYYFELNDNMLLFPTMGYMLGRSDSTNRLGFASTAFNTWRMGVGLDNFLSPSLALELIFSLSGRTASPSLAASNRDFDLSFGLSAGLVAYWR